MYHIIRWLVGLALGFYFRRIETFHAERVPTNGPVLFTSNHPNSLTDSFVIGASVPRKVHFLATVQLFRFTPVRWLLTRCGVIPINRVKDDPRSMRTVADTFEACYRVLESGQAVGIFPEGITYNDSQLKEIKSGAARMALELEQRHGGNLGLQILPVGLTFSAKDLYRSDVLAHFGEPIPAAAFLDGYTERRKECIHNLTAEIETRIKSLILDLPQLDQARVVEGIKQLYFKPLLAGSSIGQEGTSPRAEELLLTQRIGEAVRHIYATQPERGAAFAGKLDLYERRLQRLQISDQDLVLFPDKTKLASQSFGWAVMAVVGAPVALYGWMHRAIPYALVKFAVHRFTQSDRRKAQTSTAAIEAGIVAFGFFYGLCILVFHRLFGWPASFWYALSLPAASLVAHYYLRELRRFAASLRSSAVLLRTPVAVRRLLALRKSLVAEIKKVQATLDQSQPSKDPETEGRHAKGP